MEVCGIADCFLSSSKPNPWAKILQTIYFLKVVTQQCFCRQKEGYNISCNLDKNLETAASDDDLPLRTFFAQF